MTQLRFVFIIFSNVNFSFAFPNVPNGFDVPNITILDSDRLERLSLIGSAEQIETRKGLERGKRLV